MRDYSLTVEFLKNNKYTWLVTGAAGFIGSNLVERLLLLNQKVIGLDNFFTGSQKNIDEAILNASSQNKHYEGDFKFIEGSIEDINVCKKAVKNVDFVLHQAAIGSVPRSIEFPTNTNSVNINGFLNMLIAANEFSVSKFIYASSSSVYGDHVALPKIEDQIGDPLSPYAVTKTVNEMYAHVFKSIHNLESVGLRYFNIFGKRQDPNGSYAAVIPKWIEAALNNNQIQIYGDGTTSRDFCYIENAIQINILAALSEPNREYKPVYNVAVNDRTTLVELFNMIKKIFKDKYGIDIKDPIYHDFRKGDVKHSQANIEKSKKLLNYQPKFSLYSNLEETIDWYVNHSTRESS
tara:strand:- start:1544 stop:2590 length:1047 start_codon:yes stop_codon:yes gene_type:complete